MIQVARNVSMAAVGFLESGWLLPPWRCLAVLGRGWRPVGPQTTGGSLARAYRLRGGMRPCVSEGGKGGSARKSSGERIWRSQDLTPRAGDHTIMSRDKRTMTFKTNYFDTDEAYRQADIER